MADTYIKLKLYMEYIIPISIIIILFIITLTVELVRKMKQKRIEKFFTKCGYERKLFDVSSFGGRCFYGWVRETDNKRADDRDLRGLKFKTIKERYK